MKTNLRIIPLAILTLIASACAPEETTAPAETEAYLRVSGELAAELQAKLGPELTKAMQEGGPSQAIQVCQQVAMDLTAATARAEPPITIRRTALAVRNPLNAPDALSTEVMRAWKADLAEGVAPAPRVSETKDTVIVHRPILTAELCLQCHGPAEQMEAATLAALEAAYPDDAATGFQSGELRGAFRVEFGK